MNDQLLTSSCSLARIGFLSFLNSDLVFCTMARPYFYIISQCGGLCVTNLFFFFARWSSCWLLSLAPFWKADWPLNSTSNSNLDFTAYRKSLSKFKWLTAYHPLDCLLLMTTFEQQRCPVEFLKLMAVFRANKKPSEFKGTSN